MNGLEPGSEPPPIAPKRWSTTLSSNVNFPHAINFRAVVLIWSLDPQNVEATKNKILVEGAAKKWVCEMVPDGFDGESGPVEGRKASEAAPSFQTSKLNQSTRVVNIDVYYTIRPFKRTPGTKVD